LQLLGGRLGWLSRRGVRLSSNLASHQTNQQTH
jgi:hypothetical protein